MTIAISTHASDPARDQRFFFDSSLSQIDALAEIVANGSPVVHLISLIRRGRWTAAYGRACDAPHELILKGLRVAAQAGGALFDLAVHPDEARTFALDSRSVTLRTESAHSETVPMDWLKVYSAACAVRDADSARVLAEIPPEVVRRSKRVLRYDEFNQLLFEGLAALHRNDSSCRDTLLRARELAQPEHAKLSPAWADYGGLPTIELALTLVDGDAAAFNRALVHALEKHKGYWSSNAKGQGVPRRDDVDGFLALPALGLACVAHDRGMTIDVESGYMPAWIVEGAGG